MSQTQVGDRSEAAHTHLAKDDSFVLFTGVFTELIAEMGCKGVQASQSPAQDMLHISAVACFACCIHCLWTALDMARAASAGGGAVLSGEGVAGSHRVRTSVMLLLLHCLFRRLCTAASWPWPCFCHPAFTLCCTMQASTQVRPQPLLVGFACCLCFGAGCKVALGTAAGQGPYSLCPFLFLPACLSSRPCTCTHCASICTVC